MRYLSTNRIVVPIITKKKNVEIQKMIANIASTSAAALDARGGNQPEYGDSPAASNAVRGVTK